MATSVKQDDLPPVGGGDPSAKRVEPIIIRPGATTEPGALALLLQYEADMRRAGSVQELAYHVANETRRISHYDQMFVVRRAVAGEGFRVLAASSVAVVDRNAPLIHAVELVAAELAKGERPATQQRTDVHHRSEAALEPLREYPFRHWIWQPLLDTEGAVFAALIVAFAAPPAENEGARLERIGETTSHSWRALAGGKPVRRIKRIDAKARRGIYLALTVIALFPVRMSALAPAEVVAARPYVIAAPMDGVIAQMEVAPYSAVKQGQPLLQFDNVRLRNELGVAQERLAVAQARVERATSAAFADTANESRDIAILRAEYQEAEAAHAYARDMLSRAQLVAPRDGIAIYADRREWEGRAVTVGQPLMQVADPQAVELRIDLPAREQMTLQAGSPISLWLDSQPLWALDGSLSTVSYQARQTPEGVLAFALTAKLQGTPPQIGSRGTAKVSGNWVPFLYSVLKRPIASFRQFVGL